MFDRSEYSKKRYEANKERLREQQKKWYKERSGRGKEWADNRKFNNPTSLLFNNAKSRAKVRGIEFTITIDDVVIPDVCPVLGIPLFFRESVGDRSRNDNNPSIDRIDSNIGYVKGNIVVMSWRANHLKNDGTLDEFKKLVKFLRGFR